MLTLLSPLSAAAQAASTLHSPALVTCAAGGAPYFSTYDPVTHTLYIPNYATANITILKAPCKAVGSIKTATGGIPWAAAFNPSNDYVYVTDFHLNQVYVIKGTKILTTLNSGAFSKPMGITYNPGEADMVVANSGWSNLTTISGTTITKSIAVGLGPNSVGYDPWDGTLLVSNGGNVTIIASAVNAFSSSHYSTKMYLPGPIAFDPADHLDYIVGGNSPNVTAMTGFGSINATLKVGSYPVGVTFDQANLRIYVALSSSAAVIEISGLKIVKTIALGSGSAPTGGITYSEYDDKVYVSGGYRMYEVP
ncbi:MAG TPA: YncE family protein [Thermoplasmata archaeon]|nr:YncE family protein [Thermoplasmata archaeon]